MQIQDDWSRARALSAVATQLQDENELQEFCLEMSLDIVDDIRRIAISTEITRQNPAFLSYELWSNCFNPAPSNRSTLLACIDDLAEASVQLSGNTKQAEEIAWLIVDIGEWWP